MTPTFRPRSCPLCGASGGVTLLELEAHEFCAANWTYDPQWQQLLGVPRDMRFPVRRCASCGLAYATLLPDDDFLRTLYDRVIVKELCVEGSEHHAGYAVRLRYVADLLQLASGTRVKALDYGSGAGVTLRIFDACNVEAVGFDPSAVRAEYSRPRSRVVTDRAALRDEGPFSMVVFDNVLEHLADPVETVEFVRAITTEDAVVYVSVPSFEEPDFRREIEKHARRETPVMTLTPWEHLNYFSLKTLDALMARGGFRPAAPHELQRTPDIGLRAEGAAAARLKNSAASLLRLARWASRGEDLMTVERRFYRR